MLPNLMSVSGFRKRAIGKDKRSSSLAPIDAALQACHDAADRGAQLSAVLALAKTIHLWQRDYAARKRKPWFESEKAPAIGSLTQQVGLTLRETLGVEYTAFKQGVATKRTRAMGKLMEVVTPGAGHVPGQTSRHLSSEEYLNEFMDPQHRANISNAMQYWGEGKAFAGHEGLNFNQSFPEFMADLEAADPAGALHFLRGGGAPLPDVGFGTERRVHYLTDAERPRFELLNAAPGGGQQNFFRQIDEHPFDTDHMESEPGHRGWSIFAMSFENNIYTHSKVIKQLHHSSFLGGRPVKSAGTLRARQGRILAVSMASGHYKPGPAQALAVCLALLVKIAGRSPTVNISAADRERSERGRAELATIKICPTFNYSKWFNALEYLSAAGDEGTLQQVPPPEPVGV